MTEAEELQKIKAFVAEPTEEGLDQLLHLMDTSAFNMVKLEAASTILEIGFGPQTGGIVAGCGGVRG
jgi:hypothetical protein